MGTAYEGRVEKNDLAGGFWQLVCTDGNSYQLEGADSGLKRQGLRVRIVGGVQRSMFGIGMAGPHLKVESWEEI